jgi:inward rectifier potassium channel
MPAPRPTDPRAQDYRVRVVGGPPAGLRDLYHALLRVPWWGALAVIVGAYLALNVVFAALYVATGGIAHAAPGSFADAFFFSVQTMGTIGYGSMYPETRLANALVVAESVAGLVATALATGLVFARFSQTRARVIFSSRVAVAPIDGVPTVMIRVGNERANQIVGASFRASLMRTTRTAEGVTIYRAQDLELVRAHAHALARSWMILHRIDAASPLHGQTPASLAASDAELTVALSGTDDTSLQPVHAQRMWTSGSIVWGARLADVISELPDGDILLDLARFHEIEPTAPTEAFPYSADGLASPPAHASADRT